MTVISTQASHRLSCISISRVVYVSTSVSSSTMADAVRSRLYSVLQPRAKFKPPTRRKSVAEQAEQHARCKAQSPPPQAVSCGSKSKAPSRALKQATTSTPMTFKAPRPAARIPSPSVLKEEACEGASIVSEEHPELLRSREHSTPFVQDGQDSGPATSTSSLIATSSLPSQFAELFSFKFFNAVQSACFDDLFLGDNNIVISAPTGCGKTICMELALFRDWQTLPISTKAIYIAPIKALCDERYNDWKDRFCSLGIKVMQLTGDTLYEEMKGVADSHLIITTPEKWDSFTRVWRDHKSVVEAISTVLIDEVHTVGDPNRGHTLEAVVTRMKALGDSRKLPLRMIAVSATIPNLEDVAAWLGGRQPCRAHEFGPEFRPVPLEVVVEGFFGFEQPSDAFKMDHFLSQKLPQLVTAYNRLGRSTLVFCLSRKSTIDTAKSLKSALRHSRVRNLDGPAKQCEDPALRDLVPFGVAMHHAGLSASDRRLVEQLFTSGQLSIVTATSTLAMGVNMPAHLVIIKGTTQYTPSGNEELNVAKVLQMIGRAGRPQFDTHGVALILTRQSSKAKYESLLNGMQPIESSLHLQLVEHLNAEIALGTIQDVEQGMDWLRSTLFAVRAATNPTHYGLAAEGDLDQYFRSLCISEMNRLAEADLMSLDEDTLECKSSVAGKTMAKYYVAFDSFLILGKMLQMETIEEMVTALATVKEFEGIQLRHQQKTFLKSLNKKKRSEVRDIIRYPMKQGNGCIRTNDMKINCLLQATLGSLKLDDMQLQQDVQRIFPAATRLMKGLVEIVCKQAIHLSSSCVRGALLLAKSINSRMWWDSPLIAKQLPRVGATLARRLVDADLCSLSDLVTATPDRLEAITKRQRPFGQKLLDSLHAFPQLRVSAMQSADVSTLSCVIDIQVAIDNAPSASYQIGDSVFCVVTSSNQRVLLCTKLSIQALKSGIRELSVRVREEHGEIYVMLIHNRLVGIDATCSIVPQLLGPQDSPKVKKQTTANQALAETSSRKIEQAAVVVGKKAGADKKRKLGRKSKERTVHDKRGDRETQLTIEGLSNHPTFVLDSLFCYFAMSFIQCLSQSIDVVCNPLKVFAGFLHLLLLASFATLTLQPKEVPSLSSRPMLAFLKDEAGDHSRGTEQLEPTQMQRIRMKRSHLIGNPQRRVDVDLDVAGEDCVEGEPRSIKACRASTGTAKLPPFQSRSQVHRPTPQPPPSPPQIHRTTAQPVALRPALPKHEGADAFPQAPKKAKRVLRTPVALEADLNAAEGSWPRLQSRTSASSTRQQVHQQPQTLDGILASIGLPSQPAVSSSSVQWSDFEFHR
eukprot:m.155779 g.155779  ORF g.155779 m.155779 type:complete len:1317 (+) comp14311_c0_seq21:295-4245(+)